MRRTSGDLFFAEVRPFDEIFRESQNQESGESEDQPPKGQEARKLTEIQKQIISATWKLQRDGARPGYADDAKVVLDSQQQARAQAAQAAEEEGRARLDSSATFLAALRAEVEAQRRHLADRRKQNGELADELRRTQD